MVWEIWGSDPFEKVALDRHLYLLKCKICMNRQDEEKKKKTKDFPENHWLFLLKLQLLMHGLVWDKLHTSYACIRN